MKKLTKKRCYTRFYPKAIDSGDAYALYYHLKENIEWEEGIRSKNGFTRKAKAMSIPELRSFYPEVLIMIADVLHQHEKKYNQEYVLISVYLNYYEDGNMYTPNHSHKGTDQLVISLGATRKLNVARKEYEMASGSAIIFGSSVHGVPKDNSTEGRISIATFMVPYDMVEKYNQSIAN